MVIKKVERASNNYGHYGRNALLAGRTAARWGVFADDGSLVARIIEIRGFWEVLANDSSRSIAPRGFRLLAEAKAWVRANLA